MLLLPPTRPPRRRHWLLPFAAFVLAIIAQGALLLLLVASSLLGRPSSSPSAHTPRPVALRPLSEQQWAKNRGSQKALQRKTKEASREKPKPPQPPPVPPGQVVDVAPGNGEVDPNAKYVAETNNRSAQETRAKEQTAFYRNAMPRRTSRERIEGDGRDIADQAQIRGNGGTGQDTRPRSDGAARRALEIPSVKPQQEVAVRMPSTRGPGLAVANRGETEAVEGNSTRLNINLGGLDDGQDVSEGHLGRLGALNLLPSPAVVDRITGAAANDHLQDVAEGDGTYLNTREWKYASYFNRVKQAVGQQWAPTHQLRLRDPTNNVYGGRDRYTLLTITLDDRGRLRDAYVEKSSGLDFLDLEAVKAFERAQPFPNPPPGLLASDATLRFQFGFFLELTGRPGLRLFRSAN